MGFTALEVHAVSGAWRSREHAVCWLDDCVSPGMVLFAKVDGTTWCHGKDVVHPLSDNPVATDNFSYISCAIILCFCT